jgi:hypothetical protein
MPDNSRARASILSPLCGRTALSSDCMTPSSTPSLEMFAGAALFQGTHLGQVCFLPQLSVHRGPVADRRSRHRRTGMSSRV